MKLAGNVEICNRLLPTLNISRNRSQWSTLTIGKGPGEMGLYVLYQSAQNKSGTKYQVKKNIEHVFTRFINEGKATIRFKNPPHDICIQADSIQLKLFLQTLKNSMLKKVPTKNVMLSNITSTSKMLAAPKTKLVVSCKASYPTIEGFPRTLTTLVINYADQRKLDRRILNLQYLRSLDLSNNNLTTLPVEVGSLSSLESLALSYNKFGETPVEDLQWNWMCGVKLSRTLQVLDLGYNEMSVLPNQLCRLKQLTSLNVTGNKLLKLPSSLGNLSKLRFLSAGHNNLESLPGSMKRLRLESLDLAHNCFSSVTEDSDNSTHYNLGVPSLLECAAKKVIKWRVFYSAEAIPRGLVLYLDSAHYCVCGNACFETFCRKRIPLQLKNISSTVILSHTGVLRSTVVPCDAFFCSHNCVRYRAH